MNPYEEKYRQLIANGAIAWADKGYFRAKEQQEKIFQWLDFNNYLPQPGAPILEMGCGNGAMAAQFLAERGYSVWGVDFSETAIRWAERRFQQAGLSAHFLVGNVCHIYQCKDSMFELVIDGSCLHCLIDDDRTRFFAEAKRLLKPGGRLVISSMCGSPRNSDDISVFDPIRHHLLKEGHPWRTLKPLSALTNEIQEAQFNVLATKVNTNEWWDHATLVCSLK
ncbi:class I SAM-dependent methyltransferase [Enterobacter sp. C6]|uniref:class I SAM-dependent methyltransferase n=1 Tax=Enterobacter sp. C6 TaxID=1299469 RepID=UPI0011E718CD|nr:class I SAM-dependent methyltransferase [Enterobacter sp. C6]KAE8275041.1 methyltransferase domain-containing protein [Enterobacter sp. C6]